MCDVEGPAPDGDFPQVLTLSDSYLIKGYTAEERILYGIVQVVPQGDLQAEIAARRDNPDLAFVDIRSARNTRWLVRARRG